ncbi:hypothetical protein P3T76_003384 [Phytophthora citrophthora]|uniref:VPS37 C-terminal domain-containing protein n=1 Tax=Phytophthora citrophthora TaxID=4793 RepID=A0AAD9GVJ0_9STRA|nr:hypothetical protein P3T76_003384 [Phytophthora citrophthora]
MDRLADASSSAYTTVFFGQDHAVAQPPCSHCDQAPSDPAAAVTPTIPNLDPVHAAVASLQSLSDRYVEMHASYQQVLQDLTAARRHNEELHGLLQPRLNLTQTFIEFAQRRYDVSQPGLRLAKQKEAEAVHDQGRLKDRLREFDTFKAQYSDLEASSAEACTVPQDYAVGIERRIAWETSQWGIHR